MTAHLRSAGKANNLRSPDGPERRRSWPAKRHVRRPSGKPARPRVVSARIRFRRRNATSQDRQPESRLQGAPERDAEAHTEPRASPSSCRPSPRREAGPRKRPTTFPRADHRKRRRPRPSFPPTRQGPWSRPGPASTAASRYSGRKGGVARGGRPVALRASAEAVEERRSASARPAPHRRRAWQWRNRRSGSADSLRLFPENAGRGTSTPPVHLSLPEPPPSQAALRRSK